MSNGEIIAKKFIFVQADPDQTPRTLDLPANTALDCCFCIPALAESGSTDELKNDIANFIYHFGSTVTTSTLYLQKHNGAEFADVAALTGSSVYGTDVPFGSISTGDLNYIGYQLEWEKVLTAEGIGSYRVRIEYTSLGSVIDLFSFPYKLQIYNPVRADETVRVDFYNDKIIGKYDDPKLTRNFLPFTSLGWRNQLRLPNSIFGYPTSTYEQEEVRYLSGRRVDNKNEQEPEYKLIVGGAPYWLHDYIRTEVLQSDLISITDYNSTNPAGCFVEFDVKNSGGYEPGWEADLQNVPVEMTFRIDTNNLRSLIC